LLIAKDVMERARKEGDEKEAMGEITVAKRSADIFMTSSVAIITVWRTRI
jgi:hypothetical protein